MIIDIQVLGISLPKINNNRREELLGLIKGLYFKMNSKSMPQYAVPHVFLKEFTTTKSDKKKHIFRIPDETYRIQDEVHIVVETHKEIKPISIAGLDGIEDSKTGTEMMYKRNAADKPVTLTDFNIIKKLGKGNFGTVFLAEKLDNGLLYAMKQLRKDFILKNGAVGCTKLEKEILKRTHYPFLVGLEYAFQTPANIYFVMKFYRGGELYRHLQKKRRFSEESSKFYGAQIALALGELHKNKIIYRDMKPENILLDVDGYVALADFGLAKILEENQSTTTFCGTPEYIAPEIISGTGHNKQVDWWGLGILLYEMMIGIPPFHSKNQHLLYQFIKSKEVIFPDPKKYGIVISTEAKDIITRLLQKKPMDRLGAEKDVDEIMSHPFFKGISVAKLMNKEIIPEYVPPFDSTNKYDLQNFGESSVTKEAMALEMVDEKTMEIIKKNEVFFKVHNHEKNRKYLKISCN